MASAISSLGLQVHDFDLNVATILYPSLFFMIGLLLFYFMVRLNRSKRPWRLVAELLADSDHDVAPLSAIEVYVKISVVLSIFYFALVMTAFVGFIDLLYPITIGSIYPISFFCNAISGALVLTTVSVTLVAFASTSILMLKRIDQWRRAVANVFSESEVSGLGHLQELELSLRARFDELNRTWGSTVALLLAGLGMALAFQLSVRYFWFVHMKIEGRIINIVTVFITVMIALSLFAFFGSLWHMARIADAFHDAVRDLDTPFVRERSIRIFGPGTSYCAQLRSLEDTGLVISGHKVTSSGVLAILFGVIVTLLLSVAGSAFS